MNNIKIFDQDLPNEVDLSNEKAIGLDCEALGLVLGRDPLTLVQLGLESKKYFLVKLNRNNYNAPNLKKLLLNNRIQFIMHYARQDLLWLKYHLGVKVENIFCTKLASKIARTASSSHGYKDLVKEIWKSIQKNNKAIGVILISEKQISYATEFLFEIEKLKIIGTRKKGTL